MGWSDRWTALFAEAVEDTGASDDARPGRVTRHDGVAVMVATAEGVVQLPVRGVLAPPTVGDWVVVDGGAVSAVLPRHSLIRRRDVDKDVEQLIAANVDVVACVCGLDRPVKLGRIQRTAMLAWDAGAVPVVVLTKADLVPDAAAEAERVEAAFPAIDVYVVDARGGTGLERLRDVIAGRSVVLVGESGAGKSTLTNALAGEERAVTGEVRRGDAKGRHTTTARELHPLGDGAVVIDSPGIRSVGVWVDADVLSSSFGDVEDLAEACRFNDCAHDTEPGCAVLAAVEGGELAPARLDAWREMAREVAAAERRADPQAERRHGRRVARVVKEAKRQRPDQR
ncbi:ribosome small subunit-dependent GTPase A [Actinomarinicola tropica]|uniref:ribosome small subunit-dependent GTPase A n=1 Tax=Actinomarinicola tropica TaxID=2789776 RepID=UPI0038996DFC